MRPFIAVQTRRERSNGKRFGNTCREGGAATARDMPRGRGTEGCVQPASWAKWASQPAWVQDRWGQERLTRSAPQNSKAEAGETKTELDGAGRSEVREGGLGTGHAQAWQTLYLVWLLYKQSKEGERSRRRQAGLKTVSQQGGRRAQQRWGPAQPLAFVACVPACHSHGQPVATPLAAWLSRCVGIPTASCHTLGGRLSGHKGLVGLMCGHGAGVVQGARCSGGWWGHQTADTVTTTGLRGLIRMVLVTKKALARLLRSAESSSLSCDWLVM